MKMIDREGRKIRGYAIISKGDMPEKIKRGLWRIPSQSGPGHYIVESHEGSVVGWRREWKCNCPDWQKNQENQIDCKHIYAIQFWLDIKEKLGQEEQEPQAATFRVEVCPYCKSEQLIKRGIRRSAQVSKQRYSCKACGKRFVLDVAKRTKGDGKLVTLCLDLYFMGISLRKIQDHLLQFYGFTVSHMTIQRWIRRFMALANEHANAAKPEVGGLWHTDEQMVRSNGGFLWVWNCIDAKTRFLLANNVTETRFVKDARPVFAKAKECAGMKPQIVVTDGLNSYFEAIHKEFGRENLGTKHVRADGLTPKKKNNNMVERYHNSFRERDKVMRGFKGPKSATFMADSYRTYYNFIKPHMTLGGLTPARVAGIKDIDARNRWMGLLNSRR